jgi:hypothetical protein
MDEVVEGRRFPVVEPSRFLESVGEAMGTEGAEGDAEKKNESGEADAGGGRHGGKRRDFDQLTRVSFRVQAAESELPDTGMQGLRA